MFSSKIKGYLFVIIFLSIILSTIELFVVSLFNSYVSQENWAFGINISQWPSIIISMFILRIIAGLAINGFQSYSVYSVQKIIYEKILTNLKPPEIASENSSETSEFARKILLDVTNFTNGVLLSMTNVVTEMFIILIYIWYFISNGDFSIEKIGKAIILANIVLLPSLYYISVKLNNLGQRRQELERKRFLFPHTLIRSFMDVHAYRVYSNITNTALLNEHQYRKLQTLASVLQNAPRYTIEATIFSAVVISQHYLNPEGYQSLNPIIVLFIVVRLLPSFSKIVSNINSIRYYWSSGRTVMEMIVSAPQKNDFYEVHLNNADSKTAVNLQNLKLPNVPSLTPINAKLVPGKLNHIVGASGTGKTTLLKVISGLLEPLAGTIRYPFDTTKSQISYIPQNINILEGTIRDNIEFFRKNIQSYEIDQASNITGLAKILMENNLNLNSAISEGAKNISGGQAQRLAITRGIIGAPALILLDEALSGIHHSDAQELIQRLLDSSSAIIVIITHDPTILEGFPVNKIELTH